ncbi:MAG: dihydroorotate dehydrogenase, partial [Deltaproteobacteria bacterium]|nr:dihydroorotate dehydrogenase [Deltaproteobacteria bacterium]
QVGTAVMSDPRAPGRILDGIRTYMRRKGHSKLDAFIGNAH